MPENPLAAKLRLKSGGILRRILHAAVPGSRVRALEAAPLRLACPPHAGKLFEWVRCRGRNHHGPNRSVVCLETEGFR